jgi:ubiquinone/menaquinone biosynthesis C-methylase UbiE
MNKTKFWDKIAEKYYKKPISDQLSYEYKLKKTREYLKPDMHVLELGCGTGGTAVLQAPFVKSYLATDISPKMIELAKNREELKEIEHLHFKTADIDDLKLDIGSYDVVFALSLLHLLKKPKRAVKEIYDLLKPGGVFVSSTSCIADTMRFFKYIGPLGAKTGLIPYVNVFSSTELKHFIDNAGFKIEYKWQAKETGYGKDMATFIIAKKL